MASTPGQSPVVVDLSAKRYNWINNGLTILFGNSAIQQKDTGLYGTFLRASSWINEGQSVGFLGANATSPVSDSDFANFPYLDAAIFTSAVNYVQKIVNDFSNNLSSIVAVKP